MIRIENVEKTFGRTEVLKDVSLDLPRGKIIGIAGENGSGKSTLLKLIAGVLEPSKGRITLDHTTISREAASKIAYLPDVDLFYPYFTANQLFRFYETQFPDFHYDKACIVAQFLDIPLDVKLKKLSKGNRGRAKMAATLGRETDYYLMDEPFSGLDPLVREDLIKGLIQFTEPDKQTIVLSTHEIREVEPLLDFIVLLKGGKLIACEELEEVRDQYGQDAISWMKKSIKEVDLVGTETNR